jgi:site-specific DNA-cytosine methylase
MRNRQPTALVACEFSGRVRDALTRVGFYAVSCDLLPTEQDGEYFQGNVLELLDWGWDLLIAHPPCTDLATSGARHFAAKIADGRQARALDFVRTLLAAPIRFKALENPKSVISSHIRKPDQIVQPWMFGHGERKETHFWLQNLPKLQPTDVVDGREPVVHYMAPGPDRWKNRSRTYQGIADAMAEQWGRYVIEQLRSPTPAICREPQQLPLIQEARHAF